MHQQTLPPSQIFGSRPVAELTWNLQYLLSCTTALGRLDIDRVFSQVTNLPSTAIQIRLDPG